MQLQNYSYHYPTTCSKISEHYSLLCCLLLTVTCLKTLPSIISVIQWVSKHMLVHVCVCVCVEEEAGKNGVFNNNTYKSYICKQWWLVQFKNIPKYLNPQSKILLHERNLYQYTSSIWAYYLIQVGSNCILIFYPSFYYSISSKAFLSFQ